jgi:Caspase domain
MTTPYPMVKLLRRLLLSGLLCAAPYTTYGQALEISTSTGSHLMYKKSVALLIGVSEYDDQAWPDLSSIPSELDTIEKELVRQGFTVEKELGRIEGDQLASRLRKFLSVSYGRDARVVVYFAGHGWTDPDPTNAMGYIVPSDAPRSDDGSFVSFLTSMDDIKAMSTRAATKHILFVFDSCFSGSVFSTRSSQEPLTSLTINQIDKPTRQFLTSGGANQPVPAISDFAPAFVAGIQGNANLVKDNVITADELGMWISSEIAPLGKQTPQWGRMTDTKYRYGNVVFYPPELASDAAVALEPSTPQTETDGLEEGRAEKDSGRDVRPLDVLASVDILYFDRAADGESVVDVLTVSGLQFRVEKSTKRTKSNVLTCTADVPFEGVKALAASLIENGVPLRGIVPQTHNVANRITIEHLDFADQYPLLTAVTIAELTSCPTWRDLGFNDPTSNAEQPLDVPVEIYPNQIPLEPIVVDEPEVVVVP